MQPSLPTKTTISSHRVVQICPFFFGPALQWWCLASDLQRYELKSWCSLVCTARWAALPRSFYWWQIFQCQWIHWEEELTWFLHGGNDEVWHPVGKYGVSGKIAAHSSIFDSTNLYDKYSHVGSRWYDVLFTWNWINLDIPLSMSFFMEAVMIDGACKAFSKHHRFVLLKIFDI